MLVYKRHVEPLGFKGSSMFSDTKCCSFYYRKLPEACAVLVVSNEASKNRIQVFRLEPSQYKEFEKGKLSLIPDGCCNPSGGKSIEHSDILFDGIFKNAKHIRETIAAFEKALLSEGRPTTQAQPRRMRWSTLLGSNG